MIEKLNELAEKEGWKISHSVESIMTDSPTLVVNFYKPKADQEVWREEYRKKQADGVKFECLQHDGVWSRAGGWNFAGDKKDYREVSQQNPTIPHAALVKPETVTYYFALSRSLDGKLTTTLNSDKDQLIGVLKTCGYSIIGDIEERELPCE